MIVVLSVSYQIRAGKKERRCILCIFSLSVTSTVKGNVRERRRLDFHAHPLTNAVSFWERKFRCP